MARAAAVRPGRAWGLWVSAGFAVLLTWSWQGTRVDLASLLGREGLGQIAVYVRRLFPPDLSSAALRDAASDAVETFAISLIGSLLAVVIALPLSLLATRTLLYRGILFEARPPGLIARAIRVALYAGGKATLNLLRTIPEIVWALIFVFMWVRWTYPRFRIDQMLNFSWKVLIPVSVLNLVVTAFFVVVAHR